LKDTNNGVSIDIDVILEIDHQVTDGQTAKIQSDELSNLVHQAESDELLADYLIELWNQIPH
jgi:hypothetical protein